MDPPSDSSSPRSGEAGVPLHGLAPGDVFSGPARVEVDGQARPGYLVDVFFGLVVPVFLSVLFIELFRQSQADGIPHGVTAYPWRFPGWSYAITFVKLTVLMVWIFTRSPLSVRRVWRVWLWLLGVCLAIALSLAIVASADYPGSRFVFEPDPGLHGTAASVGAVAVLLLAALTALLLGRTGRPTLPAGLPSVLAGVFFVGGCHALGCFLVNVVGFLDPWLAFNLLLVLGACIIYFRATVQAANSDQRAGAVMRVFHFLLGVGAMVAIALAAELLFARFRAD